MGLAPCAAGALAQAADELASGRAPVLWLQGQSCSGCSVSLLDSETPSPLKVLTRYISLGFHQTLSSATGKQAVDTVNRVITSGGYVLIVEGSVPLGMPKACRFADETFADQLKRGARNAKAILTVGTCASFGGIPAAENNPTGATSIPDYLTQQGISTAVIRVPGCPAHPDWLVGTVLHVLRFGVPPLDNLGRPRAFYSRSLHDQCPRFADYERERFAKTFGDEGCLFKLGCLGPITKADCNVRSWNGGINNCIRAGAPCIGCGGEAFALKASLAFSTKGRPLESKQPRKGTDS